MIGTYSTIPELRWAVIAQRGLDNARLDAGVKELTAQALSFVVVVTFVALIFGYLFALGITRPIRGLVESTRAMSRAEFHERVEVRGAAEIGELADTFNQMAGHIEEYVDKLQLAAEENHELFLGSIRMLAAAIDEKDPYTRGHSGRVARYSTIIGHGMGMNAEDLDRLRIAALLHDVGKIGVDDRVLKKPGKLTDEEFDLMKQHTIKGANIMRPVGATEGCAAGHRTASRAHGRQRLSLRLARRADSADGAHHRRGRHARRHHHEPALPVRDGSGFCARAHPLAGHFAIRS